MNDAWSSSQILHFLYHSWGIFNLAFVEDDVVCDDVICGSFVFKVKYCSDRMYVVCTNFRAHTAIPMNTGRLDGMNSLLL